MLSAQWVRMPIAVRLYAARSEADYRSALYVYFVKVYFVGKKLIKFKVMEAPAISRRLLNRVEKTELKATLKHSMN